MAKTVSNETTTGFLCALGGLSVQTLAEYLRDNAGAVESAMIDGAKGAASGSLLGPLGAAGGFVAGIGGSFLSSFLKKRLQARETLRNFLTNEDISKSQALAVRAVLTEYVKVCETDKALKKYVQMVKALADESETWWRKEVNDPDNVEMERLHDQTAIEQLTNYLKHGNEHMISRSAWRGLIGRAAKSMSDPVLQGEEILGALADHLAAHFKRAWVESLKHDFAHDGKAYAAISLRYYAEILSELKQSGETVADLKEHMAALPALAAQLGKTAVELKAMEALREDLRTMVTTTLPHIADLLLAAENRMVAEVVKQGERTVQAVEGMMDPTHIRHVLVLEAEKYYEKQLEEIEKVQGYDERQRQREGAQRLLAERTARVEVVLASILKDERNNTATPVDREMNRILAEVGGGVDAAINYFAQCNNAVVERAEVLVRTKKGLDDLLTREVRQELQSKLKNAQLLEVQGKLDEAYKHYVKLLELDPQWEEVGSGFFWLLMTMSDELAMSGTLTQLKQVLEEGRISAELRLAANANDWRARRELCSVHDRLGVALLREGKLVEARTAHMKALKGREAIALDQPESSLAQQDLALSFSKTGSLLLREGQVAEARKAFEESADIRFRLVSADPTNEWAQRDLALTYHDLGDVLEREGEVDMAQKAYVAGLSVLERLAGLNPSNKEAQRDMIISCARLSGVLLRSGRFPDAVDANSEGLRLSRHLLAADPNDARALNDLAISLDLQCNLLVFVDKWKEALQMFEEVVSICRRLMAADPGDTQRQRDACAMLNKLGVLLTEDVQFQKARDACEESVQIADRLVSDGPEHPENLRILSASLESLGIVLYYNGQLDEALVALEKGRGITERLVRLDSSDARAQRDLYMSYLKLGQVLWDKQLLPSAREAFAQGLWLCEHRLAAGGLDVLVMDDCWTLCYNLSQVHSQMNEIAQAVGYAERSLDLAKAMAGKHADAEINEQKSRAWLEQVRGIA